MVLEFYKLREQPFGATPDHRFLFLSETHREALASILYGVKTGRGFIGVIAKPGMGKTTLLFQSLSTLDSGAKTVFLFQTLSTPQDFLRALLRDLDEKELGGSLEELQERLRQIVTEQARRGEQLIVVIDEAQNLDNAVLEQLRVLSNFETASKKLMQIILSGQPRLANMLASEELVQLRQRISIVVRLDPFSETEVAQYVRHRLEVAGHTGEELFTEAAIRAIAEHSQGIPRNINTLCFNALSIGAALKRRTIGPDVIEEAVSDLDLESLIDAASTKRTGRSRDFAEPARPRSRAWKIAIATASLAATVIVPAVGGRPQAERRQIVQGELASVAPNVLPLEATTIEEIPLNTVSVRAVNLKQKATERTGDTGRSGRRNQTMAALNTNEVLVRPGMNFYTICSRVYRTCDEQKVEELRRLNPWLKDSNHVEVGDVLVIPPRDTETQTAAAPMPRPR